MSVGSGVAAGRLEVVVIRVWARWGFGVVAYCADYDGVGGAEEGEEVVPGIVAVEFGSRGVVGYGTVGPLGDGYACVKC